MSVSDERPQRDPLPEMSDAELVPAIRGMLTKLGMLSELPARTYEPITTSSAPEGDAPQKTTSSYHRFRNRLLRALVEAEKEHRATVKGPNRRPETREEFRRRILAHEKYQTMKSKDVADAEKVSASYIREIRAEAKKATS